MKSDSVSKQETDEKVSDAIAKAAIVVSTRANRDRLLDLVKFQRILAPFDGVVMRLPDGGGEVFRPDAWQPDAVASQLAILHGLDQIVVMRVRQRHERYVPAVQ